MELRAPGGYQQPNDIGRTAGETRIHDQSAALSTLLTTQSIIADLHLEHEMQLLRDRIERWIANASEEMQEALRWQFDSGSKYFRPLTIFSCHRAVSPEPISPALIQTALVLEMFHNVSLIIDDIVDKSPDRRGKPTLHFKFGELPALMVSGYIVADGYDILRNDARNGAAADGEALRYDIKLFSELMKRLGVAECMQWRLRRRPLGVEDWRKIAGEDTGSMFEVCACLGTRSERLRRFGHLLGVLYHGCDDVGDVRGAQALGGGGEEDVRDGILTLPAALAIRNPDIGKLFCNPEPTPADLAVMATAFGAQLSEAEAYLDQIAEEAKAQARTFAADPAPLYALVDHTRQLSRR
jgi:geranylgeranyl pyrophosphate synthase